MGQLLEPPLPEVYSILEDPRVLLEAAIPGTPGGGQGQEQNVSEVGPYKSGMRPCEICLLCSGLAQLWGL